MKKALIIILVLAVFLTVGANAYGSDGRNNFVNNEDSADSEGWQMVSSSLNIRYGNAVCRYSVSVYSGYQAVCTTYLQRYNGKNWVNVIFWHHPKGGSFSSAKSYYPVIGGYIYRLKSYVNIFDNSGKFVEGTMKLSRGVKY